MAAQTGHQGLYAGGAAATRDATGRCLAGLPIEVLDEGPHVFHAATPEDIRAVLARLPGAAVEGISCLQLSLGSAYQAESREGNGYEEFDPYTGRLSSELFPGVYSGDILGTYTPDSGLVEIYACVCDWTKCPLPKAIGELFLKLAALKTLVHEAAHHHDWTARVGRGRWFPGTKDQRERYAEKMEREWTRDTVVPYLEATYPEAVAALLRLLDERGGLAVTLTTLAAGYFSGNWLCDLLTHESLLESRLALARARTSAMNTNCACSSPEESSPKTLPIAKRKSCARTLWGTWNATTRGWP